MKPMTHLEIEALRRRWREILKRAQEKGQPASPADIEAANSSNDPIVTDLFAQTKMALKEYLDSRLKKLKLNPGFQPSSYRKNEPLVPTLKRLLKP